MESLRKFLITVGGLAAANFVAIVVVFVSFGAVGLLIWQNLTNADMARIRQYERDRLAALAVEQANVPGMDRETIEINRLIAARKSQKDNVFLGWIMADEWRRVEPLVLSSQLVRQRRAIEQQYRRLVPQPDPTPAGESKSGYPFGYKPDRKQTDRIIEKSLLDDKEYLFERGDTPPKSAPRIEAKSHDE